MLCELLDEIFSRTQFSPYSWTLSYTMHGIRTFLFTSCCIACKNAVTKSKNLRAEHSLVRIQGGASFWGRVAGAITPQVSFQSPKWLLGKLLETELLGGSFSHPKKGGVKSCSVFFTCLFSYIAVAKKKIKICQSAVSHVSKDAVCTSNVCSGIPASCRKLTPSKSWIHRNYTSCPPASCLQISLEWSKKFLREMQSVTRFNRRKSAEYEELIFFFYSYVISDNSEKVITF